VSTPSGGLNNSHDRNKSYEMNTTKEFDGMKMTKINGNAGGRMNSDLKMLSQRQTLETQEEER
jgi:hypothetical protein